MHTKAYKLAANTLLFVGLLLLFLVPISTIGIASVNSNPEVLSAQSKRTKIQKPRKQIIMENAQKLDEEEDEPEGMMDYRP